MDAEKKRMSATKKLLIQYNRLAERERKLIFIATPLVILLILFMLAIEPELTQSQKLQRQMATQQIQLLTLEDTLRAFNDEAKVDPDQPTRIQIQRLLDNMNQLNQQLDQSLSQLVSPDAMPILLQELFSRFEGISLTSLASNPPIPLFSEANSDTTLYQHVINIEFKGSYGATLSFLQGVENIGWNMYWKQLEYSVDEYPMATIRLEVFTLSTSQAFIGVSR